MSSCIGIDLGCTIDMTEHNIVFYEEKMEIARLDMMLNSDAKDK